MIRVQNLTKYYGDKLAIDSLNFDISRGEVAGLLGINGSGKTTTLRILSGYLIPSSGEVWIDELNNFTHPMEVKKRVGYLPETPPLYEDMTVRDYLDFVCNIKSIESKSEEIEKVVVKTNLKEVLHKLIAHLSLGYRKRVGIAQSIIGNPGIVIMDEPISGLDPRQIVEIRNLIKSLAKEHTVLVSSHILNEIYLTCNRFLFLQEGKLILDLTKEKLEEQLHKISTLEIGLKGGSKSETEKFLKLIEQNLEVKFLEEEAGTFIYSVKSPDPQSYRDKLISKLAAEKTFKLEVLKRQEITLEQFFMDKV